MKASGLSNVPDDISVDTNSQLEIDALKAALVKNDTIKHHSFNPNFIDDFKGYSLGMSVEEIDRLIHFRAKGKFVNSVEEFQNVTGISDAVLSKISKRFKFPEWTQKNNSRASTKDKALGLNKASAVFKDLNRATEVELMKVYGIGEVLSTRIIKFRNALGGFLVEEQLNDVYGLDNEVIERIFEKFRILKKPTVVKIKINNATRAELATIVYLRAEMAQKIVDHRDKIGAFMSLDELELIDDFPSDKIDRIKLYLTL